MLDSHLVIWCFCIFKFGQIGHQTGLDILVPELNYGRSVRISGLFTQSLHINNVSWFKFCTMTTHVKNHLKIMCPALYFKIAFSFRDFEYDDIIFLSLCSFISFVALSTICCSVSLVMGKEGCAEVGASRRPFSTAVSLSSCSTTC